MLVKKALSGDNLELGKSLLKMHYNNEVAKIYNKEDLRLKELARIKSLSIVKNTDFQETDTRGDEDKEFVNLEIFKQKKSDVKTPFG